MAPKKREADKAPTDKAAKKRKTVKSAAIITTAEDPDTLEKPGKDKTSSIEPSNEAIIEAYEKNPEGVTVIGPKGGNWVNNARMLASYMGTETVEEFRTWLRSGRRDNGSNEEGSVAELLHVFEQLRAKNYGKTMTQRQARAASEAPEATSRSNASVKVIWGQLVGNAH